MDDMRVEAGLSGMLHALHTQTMATDLISRALHPAQLNQPAGATSAQTKNTILAKAVTGLGNQVNLKV